MIFLSQLHYLMLGLASSIAEAMACQKIVIVSDSADNKLWISNGVNGFLFRSGSSKSLYKSIISAIDKKYLWDQISFNARKTILDRNDITNEMRKMYRLMESNLVDFDSATL